MFLFVLVCERVSRSTASKIGLPRVMFLSGPALPSAFRACPECATCQENQHGPIHISLTVPRYYRHYAKPVRERWRVAPASRRVFWTALIRPRTHQSLVMRASRSRLSVGCCSSAAFFAASFSLSLSACSFSLMALVTASELASTALPLFQIDPYDHVTSSIWRTASGLSRATRVGIWMALWRLPSLCQSVAD